MPSLRIVFLLLLVVGVAACNNDDDVSSSDLAVDYSLYSAPQWTELNATPSSGLPQEQIDRWVAVNPELPLTESSSGLLYHVLDPGNGDQPTSENIVVTFYRGLLVDGTVFDSSDRNFEQRPAVFSVANLVEGFQEGLGLLGAGGRAVILIRPRLGYGSAGQGTQITSSTVLVFELTMEEILD